MRHFFIDCELNYLDEVSVNTLCNRPQYVLIKLYEFCKCLMCRLINTNSLFTFNFVLFQSSLLGYVSIEGK